MAVKISRSAASTAARASGSWRGPCEVLADDDPVSPISLRSPPFASDRFLPFGGAGKAPPRQRSGGMVSSDPVTAFRSSVFPSPGGPTRSSQTGPFERLRRRPEHDVERPGSGRVEPPRNVAGRRPARSRRCVSSLVRPQRLSPREQDAGLTRSADDPARSRPEVAGTAGSGGSLAVSVEEPFVALARQPERERRVTLAGSAFGLVRLPRFGRGMVRARTPRSACGVPSSRRRARGRGRRVRPRRRPSRRGVMSAPFGRGSRTPGRGLRTRVPRACGGRRRVRIEDVSSSTIAASRSGARSCRRPLPRLPRCYPWSAFRPDAVLSLAPRGSLRSHGVHGANTARCSSR